MQSIGIRLYLSDGEMARRVDVVTLAAYIRALEKQLATTCQPMDLWEADGLLIAIGVRPGGESRVWCEPVVGHLPAPELATITNDLTAVTPPDVRHGPIAFAFNIQLLECDPPTTFPVVPKSWLAAGTVGIPDGVFKAIWPASVPITQPIRPLASRFTTRLHRIEVADRTIELIAPLDPDVMLGDPIMRERYKDEHGIPYWPIIWPAGVMMAGRILSGKTTPPAAGPDARAIELGSGLGMAGIAAGLRGWHVTFTDYDPEAIEYALHNASRNQLPDERVRGLQMDLRNCLKETFPWVLAADVLYIRDLHPLVLAAIHAVLAPSGEAWVADPDRDCAADFPMSAKNAGFRVRTIPMEGKNFAGGPQRGNLYVLTRG